MRINTVLLSLTALGAASLTVLQPAQSAHASECAGSATALKIINAGRTSFFTRHPSGVVDEATANKNINQAASGLAAKRSNYGTAPGGSVCLNTAMLNGLYNMTAAYTLSISEIAGGSHTAGSRHYNGTAFDVATIGGRTADASNPQTQALMNSCRRAGATQVLGPGDAGHDTHVHCAW
ncbi:MULTISPECIES: hypothetical protein [Streptomyces]|uniref:Secreted protein n=1 Tax=Streptomyces gilvifuscus TaxID=1550617 RepID=A0ABT5FZJ4_9ACTN|nr:MULTISPECIES: hypothetical protein [Streptomyces]MBK3640039.1 hypothetical protein [Streptomyces sp. MBT33]MDC2957996.1 hypothetical protein [Streptomyces gilvifuscus]